MKNYFENNQYSATRIQPNIWHIHDATIANPVGLHEDGTFHNTSSVFEIEDTITILVIDLGNPYNDRHLREMGDTIAQGRTIKVAITHNHFDHTGALDSFNDCDIYYHHLDPLDNINHPKIVKEGDTIDLDNYHFEVLEVPAHTEGSIAFLERNKGWFATGDAFGSSYVWLLFMDDVISIYQNTLRKTIEKVKGIDLYFLCGHRYQQQHTPILGVNPLSPKNPDMGILYLEDMLSLTYQIQEGIAVSHDFEAFNRKDLRAYTDGRAEIDTYIPGQPCINLKEAMK